jgi:hypothetical protein
VNAFSSYAGEAMKKMPKQVSALDQKMAEKQRLSRAYTRWQRQHIKDVVASEPRLRDFRSYLRQVTTGDAGELIEAVANSWLPSSSLDVRVLALRLIDLHANKINRVFGIMALDDPMPPESSVYFEARAILYPGGRV